MSWVAPGTGREWPVCVWREDVQWDKCAVDATAVFLQGWE